MRLTPAQVEAYHRDGYLVLPGLLGAAEVAALQGEVERLSHIDADCIKREPNGLARSILAAHEARGPTASPAFRALARLPRLVGPALQLLGTERAYVYHTKINVKAALYGGIYAWHQDIGTWSRDGVPGDGIVTAMVMLDDVSEEIGGPLYFLPGSHRAGGLPHVQNVGLPGPLSVREDLLLAALKETRPVPIVGRAGTVALFHSALVHGSGHNLSPQSRRQVYVVYNPVANAPRPVASPRPAWVCARDFTPVTPGADDAIVAGLRG